MMISGYGLRFRDLGFLGFYMALGPLQQRLQKPLFPPMISTDRCMISRGTVAKALPRLLGLEFRV